MNSVLWDEGGGDWIVGDLGGFGEDLEVERRTGELEVGRSIFVEECGVVGSSGEVVFLGGVLVRIRRRKN